MLPADTRLDEGDPSAEDRVRRDREEERRKINNGSSLEEEEEEEEETILGSK